MDAFCLSVFYTEYSESLITTLIDQIITAPMNMNRNSWYSVFAEQ